MSVLMISNKGDEHTDRVSAALRADAVRVFRLDYNIYPAESTVDFSTRGMRTRVKTGSDDFSLEECGTIWNRRSGKPGISDALHQDDREYVARTSRRYLDDLRLLGGLQAVWVNDRLAQLAVDSKPNQLRIASEVGLRIPDTLITNSPELLRGFKQRHAELIMKPISPHEWRDELGQVVIPSTVSVGDLEHISDFSISAGPMIYQEKIEKICEFRIVVFGAEIVCVRLNSQAHPASVVDWRFAPRGAFSIEQVPCPDEIRGPILRFMREARIIHGSFDFALSRQGEYVFFEVNEQGQTLWIEETNPDIFILDRTCEFLTQPGPEYRYSERKRHRIANLE